MLDRTKGILFAQLNAMCAGLHFAAGVLPLGQISRQTGNDIAAGVVIAAMYYLVAAPTNILWWGLTRLGIIPAIGRQPVDCAAPLSIRAIVLSAIHIAGSAMGIALFWMGMQHASTAVAAVLSRLEILFVILLGFTLLRERFSQWQWAGFGLTLLGILLIRSTPVDGDMRGISLLLLSAVCFATALVAGKLAMQLVSVQVLMLVRAWTMAASLCIAWYLLWPHIPALDSSGWLWLVVSALAGPFLARNNYMLAVSYLPASQVVLLNQAQPIYAAFLGFLLNAEVPGMMAVLGGLAIILGNVVLIICRDNESRKSS